MRIHLSVMFKQSKWTKGENLMRVKCVLCDQINQLEDEDPLAKKLRNKPIHTYMCPTCRERISDLTEKRIATGNFVFHRSSHPTEKDF